MPSTTPDITGRSRDVFDPVPTIVAARENHGVCVPFLCGCGGRAGQSPPTALDMPMPTCTTKADRCIAVPFLAHVNHGDNGAINGRTHAMDVPLGTLTTSRGHAVIVPFLAHYYGSSTVSPVSDPVDTITTHDRHGLVYATVITAGTTEPRSDGERRLTKTMRSLGVADVGFRMLANHELSAAQGFPPGYVFHGSKADVTKQIGNSVSPNVAAAITRTLAG